MKTLFFIAGMLLFVVGCQSGADRQMGESEPYAAVVSEEAIPEDASTFNATDDTDASLSINHNARKLIKNGSLRYAVEDIEATRSRILTLISKYNAYLGRDEEVKQPSLLEVSMDVRIPAQNFEPFLNEVSQGITYFDRREVTTQDVTAEFVDLEARIKNQKRLEERYLDLLKKAASVKEMLEVERELGAIRESIERMEGRLRYLSNQLSYSTLAVTFYKEIPMQAAGGSGWGTRFYHSFREGFDTLISLLVTVTYLWPFVTIAAFIYVLVKYRKRRKRTIS